jgi:hypothetical protein
MSLLRVKESHSQFDKNGVPHVLVAGQLVDSDSPLVKGREHLFEDADVVVRAERPTSFKAVVTETADAAPGTARVRTTPPAKKATAKGKDDVEGSED